MLLHEMWEKLAEKYGDADALSDSYNNYYCTYNQLSENIKKFSMGLRHAGLQVGEHVALFSENSGRWIIVDQGIISCGAVNAIRGSHAPLSELEFIYQHSDSIALFTDSKVVLKHFISMEETLKPKFIIYIGAEELDKSEFAPNCPLLTFDEILEIGTNFEYKPLTISEDDVITLIYSSGTTGSPKGVMLTHKNLVSQIESITASLHLSERQHTLSVLPIWHAYERTAGYYMLYLGSKMFYTNPKNFKNDLKKNKIVHIVAVPRLWEAVYKGVVQEIKNKPPVIKTILELLMSGSCAYSKAKRLLNNNDIYNEQPNIIKRGFAHIKQLFTYPLHALTDNLIYSKLKKITGLDTLQTAVSGGGALLPQVEDFYEDLGIPLLVGYGLTETAPILSVRRRNNNKICSSGEAVYGSEFLIVDPETYAPLKQGEKGLVLAKGNQIMKGYYKNPEDTAKVLLPNGYFVTGDLGWLCSDRSIVLVGRQKDIIVLSNGENIESDALETACLGSSFVSQIILTGQDKNALSALVVPNVELLKHVGIKDAKKLNNDKDLRLKVLKDLQNKIKNRPNYRAFERLANIAFIDECTVENGLMTQTIKIKKNVVCEKYKDTINSMYNKL